MHAWGFSDRWAWNYPSWSISAEWAGYLAFPFLWALLRGQNGIGLMLVLPLTLLGVVAARVIAQPQALTLTYDGGLIRFFPEFIAGMAILPLLPRLARWCDGHRSALAGAVGFVAAATADAEVPTIVALWLMLTGLMLAGDSRDAAGCSAGSPGLHWLGEISYSYYMSFALVETLQATLWRRFDISPEQHQALYLLSTTALTLARRDAGLAAGGAAGAAGLCAGRPAARARARLGYPARL